MIGEASRAIRAISCSLVFPLLPFLLHLALAAWFLLIASLLLSARVEQFHVINGCQVKQYLYYMAFVLFIIYCCLLGRELHVSCHGPRAPELGHVSAGHLLQLLHVSRVRVRLPQVRDVLLTTAAGVLT